LQAANPLAWQTATGLCSAVNYVSFLQRIDAECDENMLKLTAVYHIAADAESIASRARALAVEQSVEMPVEAIASQSIRDDIVGTVEDISDLGTGVFAVRIGLAAVTTGNEPGQIMNMLFGNASILDDVTLVDTELPADMVSALCGPNAGIAGLRSRARADRRALTCSALKPQGLSPHALGRLAAAMAEGGLDFVKDDHGLADQCYSPLAERIVAVAAAIRATGAVTTYVPSLTGTLDDIRHGVALARDNGLTAIMVAPMISGISTLSAIARENPDMAMMTHPALAGVARIAPALLIGKLFRLFGGDAQVFPNHGGRFGYSRGECRRLAANSRAPVAGKRDAIPVPAGGMTLDRVDEILDFYGPDTMLLIGGNLLAAGDRLAVEARRLQDRVAAHH
jgi:ribulose-bisphosphate carboxylase large chain